jgi:hypothetical protein
MGARVYLPTLGRFTSVDPVHGGNANVYLQDPVSKQAGFEREVYWISLIPFAQMRGSSWGYSMS